VYQVLASLIAMNKSVILLAQYVVLGLMTALDGGMTRITVAAAGYVAILEKNVY